jgi:hypothetical protein
MTKNSLERNVTGKILIWLRVLMAALLLLYATGVEMVAVGEPTTHTPSGVSTYWHTLFIIHMIVLAILTLSALVILVASFRRPSGNRPKAIIGIVTIIIASICGSLSFNHILPSLTLFVVGMSVLVLGAVYGRMMLSGRPRSS